MNTSFVDLTYPVQEQEGLLIDLTDEDPIGDTMTMQPVEYDDVIIEKDSIADACVVETDTKKMELAINENDYEVIPERAYWESILGAVESHLNAMQSVHVFKEIFENLRPLRKRKSDVHFNPLVDFIDSTATSCLPSDTPANVHAIWTKGNRNCLGISVSKSFMGEDSMHIEVRARCVLEGIVNKEVYLSEKHFSKGASLIRDNEILPSIYAKYSDHYVSVQKVTESTIEYLYMKELQDCCHLNSYMGLWQLAQISSALKVPIHSVYPEGGDELMRMDFNRIFYPVNYKHESEFDDPIIIMWTSTRKGSVPGHFVPLLH